MKRTDKRLGELGRVHKLIEKDIDCSYHEKTEHLNVKRHRICTKLEIIFKLKNTVRCYVDGSYSPKSMDETLAGWGVLFENGHKLFGGVQHKGTRQIAGECWAVVEAIHYAIEQEATTLVVFYDYQGLPEWANGTWKAKNEITKQYQQSIEIAKRHMEIRFVKVDAAANKADALATAAIGIQSVH